MNGNMMEGQIDISHETKLALQKRLSDTDLRC